MPRLYMILFALFAIALAGAIVGCARDAGDGPEPTGDSQPHVTSAATSSPTPGSDIGALSTLRTSASPEPTSAVEPTPRPKPEGIIIYENHTESYGHTGTYSRGCKDPLVYPSNKLGAYRVRWSPDGSRILFNVGDGSGQMTLYYVEADGSRIGKIVDGTVDLSETAATDGESRDGTSVNTSESIKEIGKGPTMYFDVSPDGNRVAYSTCIYDEDSSVRGKTGYRYDISVVDIDGTNDETVAKGDSVDIFPVWSPDGTRLAFISAGNRDAKMILGRIFIYTVETGKRRNLSLKNANRVAPYPPAWSPDGRTIAFVAYEPDESSDTGFTRVVYTVGVDSSGLTRISEGLNGPSWSADGKRIAFVVPGPDVPALYSFAADGMDPVRIADLPDVENLIGASAHGLPLSSVEALWSPDGSEILLNALALRVAADGTGEVESLPFGFISEERVVGRTATWSPDGSRIAVRIFWAGKNYFDGGDVVLLMVHRNSAFPQALVRKGVTLVAENSGWRDNRSSIAFCSDGIVVAEPENNPGLVEDCEILIGLRDDLSGGVALNWGSGIPIEEWAGVTVESVERRSHPVARRVTRLRFPSRHSSSSEYLVDLEGRLPPELGGLEELRVLVFEDQGLDGEIPPELGKLKNLTELDLSNNIFSGEIPPDFGNLKNLEVLDLEGSRLEGEIPPELGNLENLAELNLSGNRLSGEIPPQFSNLEKLRVANLRGNELSGEIPSELGNFKNLRVINMRDNDLSGPIPPELGSLKNLRVLDLTFNSLSGPIPRAMGDVSTLEELQLGGNDLEGCIPAALQEKFPYLSGNLELPFCE